MTKTISKQLVDQGKFFDANVKHAVRAALVAIKLGELRKDPSVRFGEVKHRVRSYNQDVVDTEVMQYAKTFPGPKDGSKQRRVQPIGSYKIKKVVGRAPPPVEYETWPTASFGRFMASAPTRELALVQLANLCTP